MTLSITPPAMPRAQRVDAAATVRFECRQGKSVLAGLHQRAAARIRLPRSHVLVPEAILINTAGGLTGGDRLSWGVEIGDGASAVVTTQACEKIYRSAGGLARIDYRLELEAGARLSWLPQETILFDNAALHRSIEADLAPGARLLLVEGCLFGRLAMGERFERGFFRDSWRIRASGRLVHAEEFALGPNAGEQLAAAASAGGDAAMASVLLLADDAESMLDHLLPLLGPRDGASFLRVGGTGKLLARLVAENGLALRRRLIPMLRLLMDEAEMPKVWAM